MNNLHKYVSFCADDRFEDLMQNRIYKVLLVCSTYDAFILEEDGRLEEQVFNEYVELNLRYPPQFVRVSSAKDALKVLVEQNIDLVINMLSISDMDPFELNKKIKKNFPEIPIVVLTPFSREINMRLLNEDTSMLEYVFNWLGNSDILLAIIKLVEDKMNALHDTKLGVQVILLVEDSVRFYSSYLPLIYRLIFEQAEKFSSESLNMHQRTLHKRARPKILLARTYEEAIEIYDKYENNILGVISDIGYPKDGVRNPKAGIIFTEYVKKRNPLVPIILQSSDEKSRELAQKFNVGFLNKNSKKLLKELKKYIKEDFAFGDFVFRNPRTGEEIMRVRDLKTLQEKIYEIPDDSLLFHIRRHHFSKWLKARALFKLSETLRSYTVDEFDDLKHVRDFIYNVIEQFRMAKSRGVIAQFDLEKYDRYVPFARIGQASMGGKARGLAFLDVILKRHPELNSFEGIKVSIPRTVVLATDVFDRFMELNNLSEIALTEDDNLTILKAFATSEFPGEYIPYLRKFAETIKRPLAIRSSSLLEDSYYQPFAGIYSTYMIPKLDNIDLMVESMINAIKCVYASVYFKESKAYMQAIARVADEEKMGVVLQEICGRRYDNYFYPLVSGVARSVNVYPVGDEKPEEGIVNLAFGLGKQIVEGGVTLRFSPAHPDKILQLSDPKTALTQTQKTFFALELTNEVFQPDTDDAVTLKKLRLREAEKHGSLELVASVYDFQNDEIRDGSHYSGRKVLTFNNLLKYKIVPFPQLLSKILEVGQKEMNLPVEIEFAMNNKPGEKRQFTLTLLQIRPIVNCSEALDVDLEKIDYSETLIYSKQALGHGQYEVNHVIYVRQDNFDPANNPQMAETISKLNEQLGREGKTYVLIGPGRFGSRDPWLGIPVKWSDITWARVIVEAGLPDYQIEPSQGSHFFHNITAFKIGYFTINPFRGDGYYDIDYLNSLPALYDDGMIRMVEARKPFKIKIDGKRRLGVVMKESDF